VPKDDWSWLEISDPTAESRALIQAYREDLGPGEYECLALAVEHHAVFFSDDRAARLIARGLGLEVSGTLGALLVLVERQVLTIDEADERLEMMRTRGYRSPVTSLRDLSS
jgi:predicted nucleic acid-binding protein